MKQLFKPIKPFRACEEVANQIRDLIYAGLLRPGDKLPPERELAEQLSVSRATLREALNILLAMDLIRVFRRKGIFVKAVGDGEVGSTLSQMVGDSRQRAYQLFEVRKALEAQIVYLAAKRSTDDNIGEIRQALEDLREAVDTTDAEIWYQRDSEFHLALARATQNSVFVHVLYVLIHVDAQQLKDIRAEFYGSRDRRQRVYNNHTNIFDAIRTGNAEAAKRIAIEIFSWSLEEIESHFCV